MGIIMMMIIFYLLMLQEKNDHSKIMIMACMIVVAANFLFMGPLSEMLFAGAEIISQIIVTLLCMMTLLLKHNAKLHCALRIATLIVCVLSLITLIYSNVTDMMLHIMSLQR